MVVGNTYILILFISCLSSLEYNNSLGQVQIFKFPRSSISQRKLQKELPNGSFVCQHSVDFISKSFTNNCMKEMERKLTPLERLYNN